MNVWGIIGMVLGADALFVFAQFLITRHDRKKDEKDGLRKDIKDLKKAARISEKDSCRTQLLLLIADYPEQQEEIMTIAQHYFKDLKANWYMTSLFHKWCKANDIEIPDWASRDESD